MNNKYLEKIATASPSRLRKIIDSTHKFIDDIRGTRRDKLTYDAGVLSRYSALGKTPADLHREALEAAKDTRDARVKAVVGGATLAGAGFLGLHKYRQYQDNAIMERISQMYQNPANNSK